MHLLLSVLDCGCDWLLCAFFPVFSHCGGCHRGIENDKPLYLSWVIFIIAIKHGNIKKI